MHLDFALDTWECPGFDGEGCEHTVTSEEWHRQFRPTGYVDDDELRRAFNL